MNPLREAVRSAKDRAVPAMASGVAASAVAADSGSAAAAPKEPANILEKVPADDYQSAQELCQKLLDGGPDMIVRLVKLVGDEFGDPKGVKAKYALHGLVMYSCRPGADQERQIVAETLAGQLEAEHSDELKAFICRQLQLCGRLEELPALVKLLSDDRLCGPAAQALLAVKCDAALSALREALPEASGRRRVTISQAIDVLSAE